MEHIDNDSDRLGLELAGEIQRFGQRHDYAAVGGEHRMQRLYTKRIPRSSVGDNRRNSFRHHFAGASIAVRSRATDQDHAWRT